MRIALPSFVAPLVAVSVAVAQQPQKLDYSKNCTDAGCHDEYEQRSFVHGPVAAGACDACHRPVGQDEHRFQLMAEEQELCAFCHLESHPGKVQHQPVADGQCTACHDPHGGATKEMLFTSSVAELCAECHDDVVEGRQYVHGPVAAGGCVACHNSHASDYPAMLFAPKNEVCVQCHAAVQARIASRTYTHEPAKEDCLRCHDPHGANNKMLTTQSPPELCYSCHEEMAKTIQTATVAHDVVTSEGACSNCHDAHASNLEHFLKKKPMDLCLECHDKALETESGKLSDMRRLLEENPTHHGPIVQKNCSACHEVHGGARFRLLIDEYPAQFYVPYEEVHYALCFDCHEADVVRTEYTDKLTNFRNGERNLHYLHVHRKEKGRTCRACHETHASRRPKHIAESVPFGNWVIPIDFQITPTGGSCRTGCHKPYAYDRVKPVVNIPSGDNLPAGRQESGG